MERRTNVWLVGSTIVAGLEARLSQHQGISFNGYFRTDNELFYQLDESDMGVILLDSTYTDTINTHVKIALLRFRFPKIKLLLIMPDHAPPKQLVSLLFHGISGYLYANESPKTIVKAIRCVNAGETWLPRQIITSLLWSYLETEAPPEQPLTVELLANGPLKTLPLTQREQDIIALVAKGLANKEIARRLEISIATVKKHLRNIYRKLGVHRRTHAILQYLDKE